MNQEADIIVVGSGASGAAASWQLSKNRSLRIVCLEQGAIMDPAQYPTSRIDWELLRENDFNPNPNIRKSPSDYPIDDSDSPIAVANFNGFGGGTILYSGHFPRMHPSDFCTRTLDGVGADWPITYADLRPFFEINESMMGVSGLVGDPANPEYRSLLPPVPLGPMGVAVARGFNLLGWHWWPSYAAINTARSSGRSVCINLGPCNTGCSQGAKGSVDVTYWPKARLQGVEVRTKTRVLEVTLGRNGLADGVIYTDEAGDIHKLRSKVVVLACNGIGTPRLLLNSKSTAFPNGLGNESGLVGCNLMLHPVAYTEGVFDTDLQSSSGPQGACILSQQFYETDSSRDFVRGYTMQVLRGASPVETAVKGYLTRRIPLGVDHHKAFSTTYNRTAGIAVISEDLPELHNRVELDPERCDASGMPGVKVHYKVSENTNRILKHGLDASRRVLEAAGAKILSAFGPVRQTGWHQMGTAKMGSDPNLSVVNRYGQVHSIRNVFIVDSSVFVTSGAVNPVATAQAFTLWACDHLRENINKLS